MARSRRRACADLWTWFALLFTLLVVVPGLTMMLALQGGTGLQFSPMESRTIEELRTFRRAAARPSAAEQSKSDVKSDPVKPLETEPSSETIESKMAAAPSSVEQLPEFYGSEAIILGEERCEAFRKLAGPGGRAGAAGLFNTGTNLLWKLLRQNCVMPLECSDREAPGFSASEAAVLGELNERRRKNCAPFLAQVPWGKHNPAAWRGSHHATFYRGISEDSVLPVVMVKDPLPWFRSMCRMSYAASFRHGQAQCCPSPLTETRTEVVFRKERGKEVYPSMAALWHDWNVAYLNFTGPRLVVRYEDLLWKPREIISRVCRCAGGKPKGKDFQLQEDAAKGGVGHGNADTTRQAALRKYANETRRYEFLTEDDVRLITDHADPGLLEKLHYGLSDQRRRELLAKTPACLPSRTEYLRQMGLRYSPEDKAAVPLDDESDGVLAQGRFYPNPKKGSKSSLANYQAKQQRQPKKQRGNHNNNMRGGATSSDKRPILFFDEEHHRKKRRKRR